jgi:hypothetical protein
MYADILDQLPGVMQQTMQMLSAAQQPIISLPLCSTIWLSSVLVKYVTYSEAADAVGYSWQWAANMLKQLLTCAMAAELMSPLIHLEVRAAATASTAAAPCSAAASSSSSSSSSSGDDEYVHPNDRVCSHYMSDIMEACWLLIRKAVFTTMAITGTGREYNMAAQSCMLLAAPAVQLYVLQALASRCVLMHKQHVLYQQQQRQQELLLSPQLGKRMRGDVLLLPGPQQQLAPLMPSDAFLASDAAAVASSSSSSSSEGVGNIGIGDIVSFVRALDVNISSLSTVSSRGHPALSAATLQLSTQLLLRAAAYWQQQYHAVLSSDEQAKLAIDADSALSDLANQGRLTRALAQGKMHPATQGLKWCSQLLREQLGILWGSEQWQPQMLLLQQGGGQVLLQGLTLAVHCSGLDAQLREEKDMAVPELIATVHLLVLGAFSWDADADCACSGSVQCLLWLVHVVK